MSKTGYTIDAKAIHGELKLYPLFIAFNAANVVTMISFAAKLTVFNVYLIGKIYAGTAILPVLMMFLLQNVVVEVYGFERARHMNQISLVCGLLYILFAASTLFFSDYGSPLNFDYDAVIMTFPRHMLAFVLAFYVGTYYGDYVVSRTKVLFSGRLVYFRFIAGIAASSIIYQLLGSLVSRYGTLHFLDIIKYDLLGVSYKFLFELICMPLVYLLAKYVKRYELLDIYDRTVSYNPFKIRF